MIDLGAMTSSHWIATMIVTASKKGLVKLIHADYVDDVKAMNLLV
jgi:hypothetical protein